MKSEHRHQLETNWLAHHTAIWLERLEPYYALIVGGLIAAAIGLFAYSFFSGESAARQADAWNSYNEAMLGMAPNLDVLRKAAGEYPDSPMQELADITWADGQLYRASALYIQNRVASDEATSRAMSTYQSLLSETNDERLKSRAHFGLARAYELQNQLDKAREEYGKVEGGFKLIAEERVKQLDKPETQEVYAWLASARSTYGGAPGGPGTPGLSPGFSPGEIELPEASAEEALEDAGSIDDLFSMPSNVDADSLPATGGVTLPAEENAEEQDGDAAAGAADEAQPADDAKAAEGTASDAKE